MPCVQTDHGVMVEGTGEDVAFLDRYGEQLLGET